MFSVHRNSYLHSRCSGVNPRIINRCVDLARSEPTIHDISDFQAAFYRLTSEQPCIPTENVDLTRRPLAFGSWALPKLRRELHDEDDLVVIQALLSLCDLIRDPERGYEALNLHIPDRLADKLLDSLPPIREGAALALQIFAELADGKEAIVGNQTLLDNLILDLGDDQISVRLKVAACFEMIARSWMAADVLVENKLIETLLQLIETDELVEIVELHLVTLKSLMYECGKCVALQNNGLKIFMRYLEEGSASLVSKALDCLMILTYTKKGKKLALDKDLLKILNRLIHYRFFDVDICTSAVSVIMFCTVKTRAKIKAAEIKSLPKRLIKMSMNPLKPSLQRYCLKALTNISEHPDVRKKLKERYFKELTNMQVVQDNVEIKNILLQTVSWEPEKLE